MRAAVLLVLVAAGLAGAAPARAQEEERTKIVNCFDEGRNLVKRTALWRCKGEVVSDERAEEIRQSRILRAKNKLAPKEVLYSGMRMVASGTGFFVSSEGHLLTNHHVIDGCTKVSVKPTKDRDHAEAEVLGSDKTDDLAVVRFSKPAPAVAVFRDPNTLTYGDRIAVMGHPLHGMVAIKPIFVTGNVRVFEPAALDQWGRFAIDADIRRGNSGGPVIDDRGYVVGVVSAKVNTPAMFQKTGEVVRNVGIVIRQDRARRFLERLNIPYKTGAGRGAVDDETLSGIAEAFVARIGCWR